MLSKEQEDAYFSAHISAMLNGWVEASSQIDKSLINLSAGGVAMLVTILTTVKEIYLSSIICCIFGIICFSACLFYNIKVLKGNKIQYRSIINTVMASEDNLKEKESDFLESNEDLLKFEKISEYTFYFGISFSMLVGFSKFLSG